MSTTETAFERNNGTGLTDSTHSSSSSAERYDLDELDGAPILLYKYRGGLQTSTQRDLVAWLDKGESCTVPHPNIVGTACRVGGQQRSIWQTKNSWTHDISEFSTAHLSTASLARDCSLVLTNGSTDERLRVTKKSIPRATSFVDIKRHDLYLEEEKEQYAKLPNFDSNLASIKVPSIPYWSRLLLGNYETLYIVSPSSSPNSSVADDDSRRTSPTNTWGCEAEAEASLGAVGENGVRS
jgi:hypothetical protein